MVYEGIAHALSLYGLPFQFVETIDDSSLFISCNVHENVALPKRFIAYNFEQFASPERRGAFAPARFRKALEVWDYSQENLAMMRYMHGIDGKFVPFGYTPKMEFCGHPGCGLTPGNTKHVVTFGASNERRQRVNAILNLTASKANMTFTGHTQCFGDCYLSLHRAFLAVNVHFYPAPNILEVHRILPLIANGVVVISERSYDTYYDRMLADVVMFASTPEEIANITARLGGLSQDVRKDIAIHNYLRFRARLDFSHHLHSALCL